MGRLVVEGYSVCEPRGHGQRIPVAALATNERRAGATWFGVHCREWRSHHPERRVDQTAEIGEHAAQGDSAEPVNIEVVAKAPMSGLF